MSSSSHFVIVINEDQSKSTCSGSDSDASEECRDKNTRTGRSNRGRSNTRTGTRRTGTRRGVQATVNVTTGSMIVDLKEKEEKSDKQATFDEELSKMGAVLKKAKKCIEEGGNLTIPFLKALIKSKGTDPPIGRKKAPFEAAWNEVKDDADWERTAFFTEQDKKDLQLFEDDNSEDEE